MASYIVGVKLKKVCDGKEITQAGKQILLYDFEQSTALKPVSHDILIINQKLYIQKKGK